jgi:hypothetical protein
MKFKNEVFKMNEDTALEIPSNMAIGIPEAEPGGRRRKSASVRKSSLSNGPFRRN